jgi:hypothetical protein
MRTDLPAKRDVVTARMAADEASKPHPAAGHALLSSYSSGGRGHGDHMRVIMNVTGDSGRPNSTAEIHRQRRSVLAANDEQQLGIGDPRRLSDARAARLKRRRTRREPSWHRTSSFA